MSESVRNFSSLSGNYRAQLLKNIQSQTLTPTDDRYCMYYLKAPCFPFQGISDVHCNILGETFPEFHQRHSNEIIIPPMNRCDVTLTRDTSINILHLLQPENLTAELLAKNELSEEDYNELLTFPYNLIDDPSTTIRFLFIYFFKYTKIY